MFQQQPVIHMDEAAVTMYKVLPLRSRNVQWKRKVKDI
jgi:hypothetical protein